VISDLLFALSGGRINGQSTISPTSNNNEGVVEENFEMHAIQTWSEVGL
jgi:hypothetical protein